MISVLRLRFEAFRFKSYPRPDFDELGSKAGLPISKSPPLYVSSFKFTDDPWACRLSFERVLDTIFSRSSKSSVTQHGPLCYVSGCIAYTDGACEYFAVEKTDFKLEGTCVYPTQEDSFGIGGSVSTLEEKL